MIEKFRFFQLSAKKSTFCGITVRSSLSLQASCPSSLILPAQHWSSCSKNMSHYLELSACAAVALPPHLWTLVSDHAVAGRGSTEIVLTLYHSHPITHHWHKYGWQLNVILNIIRPLSVELAAVSLPHHLDNCWEVLRRVRSKQKTATWSHVFVALEIGWENIQWPRNIRPSWSIISITEIGPNAWAIVLFLFPSPTSNEIWSLNLSDKRRQVVELHSGFWEWKMEG